MFPAMISLYVVSFCRVTIGLVFMLSSISKVRDIALFKQTISSFNILPIRLNGIATVFFLCGEFAVVAFVLIGGSLLAIGFSLAIFLLLLFCIALVSVLVRRIRTSCNCFGPGVKQVSYVDVWRNTGLILCALVGCEVLTWTKNAQESPSLFGCILIGLGAVVFVAIWIQMGEIVQLFR